LRLSMMATSFLEYLKHRGQLHPATNKGVRASFSLPQICTHLCYRLRMSQITEGLPPFVDPEVEYVGVGKLRQCMTTDSLERLRRPLLVLGVRRTKPVAVLISYSQFLEMQEAVLWRFRDDRFRKDD